MDDVAARTGGVPLFVEEVTRLLLERGEQGGIQAIPPTLQQSLMARLDRLGPAREVAQIGAVIGRDFSYALLPRWPAWRTRRCKGRWNDSPRPTFCWCRACRQNRISFQARAHSGRRLREFTKEPASGFAPPRRRNFARSIGRMALPPSRSCWRITSPRRA